MLKKIKYFIQRGRRGYSDEDIWDFHDYLCSILIPVLKEFSKKNMGCPGEFWDKESKNDECHKWSETLEEMSQGFEAAQALMNMQYFKMKKNEENGCWTRENDEEKHKLLTEKYNRGMKLFSENFMSLWD
jgi:hypothetical protein